ncbi:MAG TPA: peptidylprolyl isomerase, partial [Rhodobacteraceae bacterium]|nr:peptidylprolyl isomerase [Paracoccaceae bacterium]
MEVDEAALRTLYDEQSARFNIPARRIVDRLVYPNQATAQAALDSLSSGAKTFETLVTERGLTLADVDLGEVSRADLTGAAADAVFLLTEPGVAGPVETDLGPALFQVNAVLEAQNTSFEQVSDELHAEYVADRARRQIDDGIVGIDDLLAGGNTLEEIA